MRRNVCAQKREITGAAIIFVCDYYSGRDAALAVRVSRFQTIVIHIDNDVGRMGKSD